MAGHTPAKDPHDTSHARFPSCHRHRHRTCPPPHVCGAVKLVVDAVGGVTGIVESMHQRIASGAPPLGQVPDKRTRGITGFVYRTVRGTTSLVGGSLDLGLTGVEKLLGPRAPAMASGKRDAIVAAVNGVCGDHLERTRNPLALPMTVRPAAGFAETPHLLVVIHGLCMTPAQWTVEGHDHGKRLATELGATPVYVGYNTGRHIGTNGAVLAAALQELVARWSVPVQSDHLAGPQHGRPRGPQRRGAGAGAGHGLSNT